MKKCCAGHEMVGFWTDRCPVCATIYRLDKALLRADVQIAELEEKIGRLALVAEFPEFREWNGGHS